MGNRKWGIALNKALPSIVNFIPGYNVVKSINDHLNKTSGTAQIPINLLETVSSEASNVGLLNDWDDYDEGFGGFISP